MRRQRSIAAWVCALCIAAAACHRIPALLRDLSPRHTPPIVKIGLTAPFEGRYRALGYEALYAVKWAVRQRNASGGVAGYQVELVALNDNDDPQAAAVQADKFAADTTVMGVIGPFSSESASAVAPTFGLSRLAVLTPATCTPDLLSDPDEGLFCLGATVEDLSQALTTALPPERRVGLLQAAPGLLAEALQPVAGLVYDAPWTADTTAAMREDAADLYLYDGDVLSAADLLVQMRDAGIDAPLWGGPALARAQLTHIAGAAAAESCYVLTAPMFADLSLDSAFVQGYRDLAGGAPGPWAALAYDATELLLDALERAIDEQGKPTRQAVIGQLATARGPDGELAFQGRGRREAEVTLHCVGDQRP